MAGFKTMLLFDPGDTKGSDSAAAKASFNNAWIRQPLANSSASHAVKTFLAIKSGARRFQIARAECGKSAGGTTTPSPGIGSSRFRRDSSTPSKARKCVGRGAGPRLPIKLLQQITQSRRQMLDSDLHMIPTTRHQAVRFSNMLLGLSECGYFRRLGKNGVRHLGWHDSPSVNKYE
jgi:hypothetical protein